jgi:hypothetical protein
LILIFFIIITACENEGDRPIDSNYPTTYYKLSEQDFKKLNEQYLKNKYCGFTGCIDSFGFCSSCYDRREGTCQLNCQPFDKQRAKKIVFDFIKNNKPYTGIIDTTHIKNIEYKLYDWGSRCNFIEGSKWVVLIGQQYVHDLEVKETDLFFSLDSYGIVVAKGNWYPEIYIPEEEEISYTEAQKLMIGKKFKWMCWTEQEIEITENIGWEEPESRKFIRSIRKNDRIELHVVWLLKTMTFNIEVDIMTGEIILYYSDYICK